MSSNPNPLDLKAGYLNWWQSLLLAFSCTLTGLIAAYSAMTGMGATGDAGQKASWAKDLLKLTPHALLLFGLMADAITYDGVYWTSTIVGLSAAGLHSSLEYLMDSLLNFWSNFMGLAKKAKGALDRARGVPAAPDPATAAASAVTAVATAATTAVAGVAAPSTGTEYNGCTVTGETLMTPGHRTAQTLVVTAAVISYLFMDIWFNRGIMNGIGTLVLGTLLFAGQAMSIQPTCFPESDTKRSLTSGVLYGMLYGTIVGGSFYAFFQGLYPMYLPSSVIPIQNWASQAASISSTGFVYVPGQGLVSVTSPAGQQAIAAGTAMSPDDMSKALQATGTPGSGQVGVAATCS